MKLPPAPAGGVLHLDVRVIDFTGVGSVGIFAGEYLVRQAITVEIGKGAKWRHRVRSDSIGRDGLTVAAVVAENLGEVFAPGIAQQGAGNRHRIAQWIEPGGKQVRFAVSVHVLGGEAGEIRKRNTAAGVRENLNIFRCSEPGIGFGENLGCG